MDRIHHPEKIDRMASGFETALNFETFCTIPGFESHFHRLLSFFFFAPAWPTLIEVSMPK